jgi:hypothetical protein
MEKAAIGTHQTGAATTIAEDLLEGAQEIAEFLFGHDADRRRVYYLLDRGLPHFKLGARIFARRSSIMTWVARQEVRSDR